MWTNYDADEVSQLSINTRESGEINVHGLLVSIVAQFVTELHASLTGFISQEFTACIYFF
jgi:hypothetical protein